MLLHSGRLRPCFMLWDFSEKPCYGQIPLLFCLVLALKKFSFLKKKIVREEQDDFVIEQVLIRPLKVNISS